MKNIISIVTILLFALNLLAQNNIKNTYLDADALAKVYNEYKFGKAMDAYESFDTILNNYK